MYFKESSWNRWFCFFISFVGVKAGTQNNIFHQNHNQCQTSIIFLRSEKVGRMKEEAGADLCDLKKLNEMRLKTLI